MRVRGLISFRLHQVAFFGNGEWCKYTGPAGEPWQVWLSAGEALAHQQSGTDELERQVRAEGSSDGGSDHAKGQAHPEAQWGDPGSWARGAAGAWREHARC